MIKEFVDSWYKNYPVLENALRLEHPESYTELVNMVIGHIINPEEKYGMPDRKNMTVVDNGDYQGTLVYVIPEIGYQPSDYWYVRVYYGSCSGCDTLQAIRDYGYDKPTEKQVNEYMTLALHIVQRMKKMDDTEAE